MHSKIILWSVVSALAGFLFGFDTVVISGAERTIQELWGLSPELHGVAVDAGLTPLFPPSAVFAFFCGMMGLQLVWVLTMVPETKGVPLEELATRLGK